MFTARYVLNVFTKSGRAMNQSVGPWPLTVEAQAGYQVS